MPVRTSRGDVVRGFQPTYANRWSSARVTSRGYVHNVSTHSAMRGQGHGTALMAEIIQDADRLGRPLSLNAREDLHPWYRGMGFERTEAPENPFPDQPFLVRHPRR